MAGARAARATARRGDRPLGVVRAFLDAAHRNVRPEGAGAVSWYTGCGRRQDRESSSRCHRASGSAGSRAALSGTCPTGACRPVLAVDYGALGFWAVPRRLARDHGSVVGARGRRSLDALRSPSGPSPRACSPGPGGGGPRARQGGSEARRCRSAQVAESRRHPLRRPRRAPPLLRLPSRARGAPRGLEADRRDLLDGAREDQGHHVPWPEISLRPWPSRRSRPPETTGAWRAASISSRWCVPARRSEGGCWSRARCEQELAA